MRNQEFYQSHNSSEEIIWQVISFFAADSEIQVEGLGTSSYDFFYSNDDYFKNNENYLIGLYMSYVTYWGSFKSYDDDYFFDEQSVNFELKAQLDLMYWATEKRIYNFWTKHALRESPIWRMVRKMAAILLENAGLPPEFPKAPLCIEDIVEAPTDQSIRDLLEET
ncbi:MAG: hypothetical protein WAO71_01210 [Gallionella sp.]